MTLDWPLVYLISDGSMTDQNYPIRSSEFLRVVKAASDLNIPLVQIREKKLNSRRIYELAASIMKVTRTSKTKVLVNDRLDIALAAGADGVHLPSRSIPVDAIRKYVPKEFIIGFSAHSTDEIDQIDSDNADFAVLGPVFYSPGKGVPVGLDVLRTAVRSNPHFPILGLGGIDNNNYHDVLQTGAAGFAAIRFLSDVRNIENVSRDLGL